MNDTNPKINSNNFIPDYSGYLIKQSILMKYIKISIGMWLKQWRLRYFSLKNNKLYFSKGPNVYFL